MYGQAGKKLSKNSRFMLDLIHIVIGLAIVVMAVISFLNPDTHLTLFPVIFFLAAVLNFVNGYFKIDQSGRSKKKKVSGILLFFTGLCLTALAVLSAISLWR